VEWDGVGGEDGKALPVTPEGIFALMDLWPIAEAFERLYLGPALLLEQEKTANGSLPLAFWRRAGLLRFLPGCGFALCAG